MNSIDFSHHRSEIQHPLSFFPSCDRFYRIHFVNPVLLFSTSPTTSQPEASTRDDLTPLSYRCNPSTTTAFFPCSFCGFCASLWLRPNCRRASPIPRPHSVHHNHFFIRVDWCSFVVLFSASPLTSQSEVSARDDPTPLRYRCSPSNTTALLPAFVLWILCRFVASVKLPPLKGLPLYLLFMRRSSSPMPCAG